MKEIQLQEFQILSIVEMLHPNTR